MGDAVMKVVINKCFGGFGLSEKAILRYAELKGLTVWPKKDKKFINKILKQVENGATDLYVVDDKLGTPTYTLDFDNSIFRHVNEDLPFGFYNMVCSGDASRYDVACKIKEILNLNINVHVVNSDYFKQNYFAPRPLSEKMINRKLNDLNRNYMRNWEVCLSEYLKEYYGK